MVARQLSNDPPILHLALTDAYLELVWAASRVAQVDVTNMREHMIEILPLVGAGNEVAGIECET